jgi:hypothetical protein
VAAECNLDFELLVRFKDCKYRKFDNLDLKALERYTVFICSEVPPPVQVRTRVFRGPYIISQKNEKEQTIADHIRS